MAVLAACGAQERTPASSPLTKAYKEILGQNLTDKLHLDPEVIKEKISEKLAKPIVMFDEGYAKFSLSPGLTIVSSCNNPTCGQRFQHVPKNIGLGNVNILVD